MLVEKEIISPGEYWYTDESTGMPRKLSVTPELTKYWYDQGSAMLSAGLTVPVPFEHDFSAHPMTPKDKLLNNAGEVKEYRLKDDRLFGVVDVQDPDAKRKIGHSIRWTSPWINSFTDGQGKQWNNVISHLALTTRPRVTKQTPFPSIAAALSMATPIKAESATTLPTTAHGFCISRAGRLIRRKKDKRVCPRYPIAFSLMSGAALASDDMPPPKKKGGDGNKPDGGGKSDNSADLPDDDMSDFEEMDGSEVVMDDDPTNDNTIDLEPFNDPAGDVKMEELLCDLLGALGIHCEKTGDEAMFKRSLYNAAMTKIHELTGKAQNDGQDPNRTNPPGQPPNNPPPGQAGQTNPLIQQEQQPMYMSLDEINKLPEPMRGVALAMYTENQKLRAEMDASTKTANSLRDAKLKEEETKRQQRVLLLGRLSPKVKADLEAMMAMPSMALSMGDGGAVVNPMEQTLSVLEKGLSDMPRLLTTEQSALSVQSQPTDGDMLSDEQANKLADDMARMMGCPPEKKAS